MNKCVRLEGINSFFSVFFFLDKWLSQILIHVEHAKKKFPMSHIINKRKLFLVNVNISLFYFLE